MQLGLFLRHLLLFYKLLEESDEYEYKEKDFRLLPEKESERILRFQNEERIEIGTNYREFLKKKPFLTKEKESPLEIKNLVLRGKVGKYGVESSSPEEKDIGSFERALRYKKFTDFLEDKYMLPRGLLISMIIVESTGVDPLPNARNDGGIGVCHMQPSTAQYFGLKTYQDNRNTVDRKHGLLLRKLIQKYHGDTVKLSRFDERFNPLKNLDAVARMVTFYIHGDRKGAHLRASLKLYSSGLKKENEAHALSYWERVTSNMKKMKNPVFLKKVEDTFNKDNENLRINGKKAENPFRMYLEMFWKVNSENFGFDFYKEKNPAKFTSKRQVEILRTIDNFLV